MTAPLWLGAQPIQGKTILLLAEQGFGDTINFARYAPLVAALGATVILDVPSPLKEIAASVPGVALVLEDGEPVPPVDFYCPLMSLPLAFQTEIGTIPANIPYIRPHAERLAKWRDQIAAERPSAHRFVLGRQQRASERSQSLHRDRALCRDFVAVQS